jgi:hypothetical protein
MDIAAMQTLRPCGRLGYFRCVRGRFARKRPDTSVEMPLVVSKGW